MENGNAIDTTETRLIRVFVSSTFRDMQGERDELGKFIFPQLRKLCEKRGVTCEGVDLRWGIPVEKKSEVLSICLKEIQNCRPYFIGMLGERYGSLLNDVPAELMEREPWLKGKLDRSVTELEILHGVLNDPNMADHAFFYFRDPKYIETLPPEQRVNYEESESSTGKQKLKDLKKLIKRNFPVQENYHNPKEFGRLVLQDLTAIIEELYPEGSQPAPLDREATDHEIFAQNRRRAYIYRPAYYDQLDAQARTNGAIMVVLGESGSGKSALLANWATKYRKEHPDDLVLMHFIGANPTSTDWAAMLRRILGEIKRKYDLLEEIPDRPESLRNAFPIWLNMAAVRGRVVLILDGLNQLEDHDGAPDLVWLPSHIPENICIFLSTLPGRPLDELQKRGCPSLRVEPLQLEERTQLIEDYLKLSSKVLNQFDTEHIANAEQSRNPLFLRLLLDELRLFGNIDDLGKQIDSYLGASTIPALYELILKRCGQDYESERSELVQDVMSLLWAARRGLSEAELMDLLGSGGQPLPHAYWSPLFLALEQSFLNLGGVIGFSHEYIRQAVSHKYLQDEDSQKAIHLKIADYFSSRELGPRQIDELPWQLSKAESWDRLYTLLTDIAFFRQSWRTNKFEVRALWSQLERSSPLRLVNAFQGMTSSPQKYDPNIITNTMFLFADFGHNKEALVLGDYLIEHFRAVNDPLQLAAALGNQALLIKKTGDLEWAMAIHKEQERICRDIGDMNVLQHALGSQADILFSQHDLVGAMALYGKQEQICRDNGYRNYLAASLSNQASICNFRGDLKAAMAFYQDAERICKETGYIDGLSRVLGDQATILCDWGDLDGAMTLRIEQERISRELGDLGSLHHSLGGQADIFLSRGEPEKALELFKIEEQICRQLEDWDELQKSLGRQATILKDQRDLEGATSLYREQENICNQYGLKHRLISIYLVQSVIRYIQSDLDGAQRLCDRARQVAQNIGDKYELGICLGSLASLYAERRDLDGALTLYQDQEKICRELKDQHGLQYCLGQQAGILNRRGEFNTSVERLLEREKICRQTNHLDGLQATLGSLGVILKDAGSPQEAMNYLIAQEQICRKIGNRDGLQCALGDQANILYGQGKLEESLKLHAEEEQICREIKNLKGLQGALGNKGGVLLSLGKSEEAMALFKEKEKICREIKEVNGLVTALSNQAVIYVNNYRNFEKARLLIEEALHMADDAGLTGRAQQMKQFLAQIGY